jgi:uncharacterized membrane protein
MTSLSLLCILVVPFLYMVSNLVDKFQLRGDDVDSRPGALMALGGFFAIVGALPLGMWIYATGTPLGGLENAIPLLFNELLYLASMWIYLAAMKTEEPSRVVPYFQAIPVFGLVGAFLLLHEKMTAFQLLAVGMLAGGGFLLSFHKGKVKKKLVGLMLLSAALMAGYDVVFAEFGRDLSPAAAIFIALVAKMFWTIFILIGKQERRGFVLGLRTRLKVQAVSELACLLGDVGLCYFLLVFPVAFVQAISCTQPLFVLVAALLLSRFFPKAVAEEIRGLTLAQKAVGVALMVAGGIILSV